jgi:helicase
MGGLSEIKRGYNVRIPIRGNLYKHVSRKDPGKTLRYSNTIYLVKYFINNEKQCIVFTNGRQHAEKLAISLVNDVNGGGYKIDKTVCAEISQLLDESIEEKTEFSKNLVRCASLGVCFHHAGLQLIYRDIIEKAFIAKKLKALVATPTLEQGVNLPSNVVIIADATRWNAEDRSYDALPVNNVINMMGRAGRPEYHDFGEAILVEDQATDDRLYVKYIAKEPERVLSQLREPRTRRKHLNGLIASVVCRIFCKLDSPVIPHIFNPYP